MLNRQICCKDLAHVIVGLTGLKSVGLDGRLETQGGFLYSIVLR